jgi:glycosyltransferase involved in cell wall biosynthesis
MNAPKESTAGAREEVPSALLPTSLALSPARNQFLKERIEPAPFVDVSVVIPAYNEQGAIVNGVAEVQRVMSALGVSYDVIVVNDGSTDATGQEAEKTTARVLHQRSNKGYGAALKRGILAGNSTYVVITDADGTYPPSAIPAMLELAHGVDMVVADRGAAMKNVPLIRKPAKFMLNSLARYLAKRKINDLNSGLRVFRRSSLLPFIRLLPEGFSFTTTITLCMICSDLDVVYVPITYGKRIGTSKIRATDFFAFVVLVVRVVTLFRPLRVFFPLGVFWFMLGTVKLAYDVYLWNLSESAVLAFVFGVMAWSMGLMADMISRLHLRP